MATDTMSPAQYEEVARILGTSVADAHDTVGPELKQGQSASSILQGLISSQGEAPTQAQLRHGAEQTYGFSASQWAKLSPKDKAEQIKSYANDPNSPQMSAGLIKDVDATAANPTTTTAETPKQKAADQAKETKTLENEIASGPWSQLSQSVIKEYQNALSPIEPMVSGAATPAAVSTAEGSASQALASVGAGGLGSIAGNVAAGQAIAAPVAAAEQAYGKDYAASTGPITKALAAYGQANQLEVNTAPESAWLSALASHITSNLSYYGEIPTAAAESIPASVTKALELSGGYGGSTAGLTPLQNLGTKDGQTVVPKGAGASATASDGGGTIPTSSGPSAGG